MARAPSGGAGGLAVGVDVGGTKLAAGLVGADGSLVARTRRDTPPEGGGAAAAAIAAAAEELITAHAAAGIPVGVGAAGLVDGAGTVRYAPNIPGWAGFPLAAALRERLDTPVRVDNDVNVAAWAEHRIGAGADLDDLVLLAVGTGIGGGLVLGGRLQRGATGLAGEYGHIVVAEGGPRCSCGNHGCLEAMASGTAIARLAVQARHEGRIPGDSPLAGEEALTGKAVTVAAHRGDAAAREVLAEAGRWLGVGIAGLVNALDPSLVVLGGGAMEAGELLLAPAREHAEARVVGAAHRTLPPIVRAQLVDEAGVVGAGLLALAEQPGRERAP